MIVPSIDIQGGSAVQLIEGRERVIDAGDPRPLARTFGRVGEIAVIDLDGAMGTGSNEALIREILEMAPCRVGGGIRDASEAIRWLDAGARKVILGTAARPEVLRRLPRQRVIVALDARDGEVVVEGWKTSTGRTIEERIEELRNYADGFLVTFVEREGHMGGLPMERVRDLVRAAAPASLTVAGGVRCPEDIARADHAGAGAQVGMALYTGAFDLAEGFWAPLRTDRSDGLIPTVVCDEMGSALGLAYSSLRSLRVAIERGVGAYESRSRGEVWIKGETSGNTQELVRIDADCDRDAIRMTVRQRGRGFCHLSRATCFGDSSGLSRLDATLSRIAERTPEGSYTSRLLREPELLRSKLVEEACELADASARSEVVHECADLLYFALVRARSVGVGLSDICHELDRRSLRVTRRAGDAKPGCKESS